MRGAEPVARLLTRWVERRSDLPPAETRDVGAETVAVPMPDGTDLEATHYYPRDLDGRPTVLVRTPYPRTGMGLIGRLIAERGFHVLFQSCRGTFGSGGEFVPFENERADGLATIEWLDDQPWFTGELGTTGMSYLGYTQWAVADHPAIDAMSTQATASNFERVTRPGGAFALGTSLRWAASMADSQSTWRFFARSAGIGADVEAGFETLPLVEADRTVVGEPIDAWRRNFGDPDRWREIDHSDRVADAAPTHHVGGWYDIALPPLLDDYRRQVDAGAEPYLTIGPWGHMDPGLNGACVDQSIRWLRARLVGDEAALREDPVRLFVQRSTASGEDAAASTGDDAGAQSGEWRTFESWPPSDVDAESRFLQPDGELGDESPGERGVEEYRYDPADPTPSVGGATFDEEAGQADQTELEARDDVLTYTTDPLSEPVTAIGPVSAELFVESSRERADIYACLCDVDPTGASLNVCDGIRRVAFDERDAGDHSEAVDGDGVRRVEVELWPTAYRFGRGHRLRLQIASGAF
ncbi:CocE/NonD family hydrolase, partial [Natronoarchaeum mannanilyticum]|uniref:CocE/NonD family hydrolase n=1 Tax=Natronoarchaeum mannanilyticum TaxID=926360 RepID=UPI00361732FF